LISEIVGDDERLWCFTQDQAGLSRDGDAIGGGHDGTWLAWRIEMGKKVEVSDAGLIRMM
jgi:hypothetical protein